MSELKNTIDPVPQDERRSRFVTTQWQLIKAAGGDSDHAVRHLDKLLRLYLPALQGFLITRYKLDRVLVDDVLQEFVTTKILRGNLVRTANPERGRFRTLLLTSLTRYVTSVMRRLTAAKRIPDGVKVPWDLLEDTGSFSLADNAEKDFDPRLNEAIVKETIRRFRRHCDRRRKLIMWEVFEGRLINPFLNELPEETYDHLVKRLQLASTQQASNLLMTAKRSFSNILKTVIEEFALNADDAEQELRQLQHYCGFATEVPPEDA